jgi:UDP-N-acetylglucosamine 2-epimerase (non-hydrolysing)
MRPFRIVGVVGARPNFMKMAPVLRELRASDRFRASLVHTGQHYDPSLSGDFIRDLDLQPPDVHLEVGSATHAVQTARILERFEPVVRDLEPDLVLVAGDVNSTIACALAAVKLGVPTGHVEAGLRSGDRTMPEEINRVLTDAVSDLLFTTSRDADENLRREGRDPASIHFVGNPMIDTLRRFEAAARDASIPSRHGLSPGGYVLATLHRPSNVDRPEDLDRVIRLLSGVSRRLPALLPLHPRTRARLESTVRLAEVERLPGVRLLPPLRYLEFLGLMIGARAVLTDSGGVQEETTALGVPCLTLRPNTERPVTVTEGTNLIVSEDPDEHLAMLDRLLEGRQPVEGRIPERWDGQAAGRIVGVLDDWFRRGAPSSVRGGRTEASPPRKRPGKRPRRRPSR